MFHTKVFRPWGFFDVIKDTKYFKIKLISINPGQSISYQYHNHRNEHWIVITGCATVQKDNEVLTLHENESTFISKGTKHRLSNNQTSLLNLIEIQTGEYLGEDDIVRIEDLYGR